ncbi:WD40-repeat-containing domain protein [Aspergillus granulosus]|uniref:WD40-repeat-containing domain protein n=1 Tax=Aspergillus granulosus TaxID=176169 RepID=A0ABR4H537_9EURO
MPYALAFSADCRQVAAVGYDHDHDRYIMLFDAGTGDLQKIITGNSDAPIAMAYSPVDMQLVAGYYDGTIRLWDPTTGDLQKILVGHTDRVWNVAFSPDGTRVVSACHKAVNFWDAATGDLQGTSTYPYARTVAFSPDGKQAAACFNYHMIIWDAAGKVQKAIACQSAGIVTSMAFSPNGKEIVTGSDDTTIRRWGITLGDTENVVGHSGGL